MRVRLVVAGLAALLAITACGKSDAELKVEAELQRRTELRAPLVARLKDPGSATFRNESLHPDYVLCGEFNSKNGMGGYAGYSRFIVSKGNFVDFEGGDLSPIDKNGTWTLMASMESISKGYDVQIADQRRQLGLPVQNKAPQPSGFEKRWTRFCV